MNKLWTTRWNLLLQWVLPANQFIQDYNHFIEPD